MDDELKSRITVTVDRRTADKIAELARRMNTSQSKMASMLLESGVEDNEWIIKLVTSRVVLGLRDALGAWSSKTDSELVAVETEVEGSDPDLAEIEAEPVPVIQPVVAQGRKGVARKRNEGNQGAMV